jgi:hypothetical protein
MVREQSCQSIASPALDLRESFHVSRRAGACKRTAGSAQALLLGRLGAVGRILLRMASNHQRLIAQSACEQLASPSAGTRGVPGAASQNDARSKGMSRARLPHWMPPLAPSLRPLRQGRCVRRCSCFQVLPHARCCPVLLSAFTTTGPAAAASSCPPFCSSAAF